MKRIIAFITTIGAIWIGATTTALAASITIFHGSHHNIVSTAHSGNAVHVLHGTHGFDARAVRKFHGPHHNIVSTAPVGNAVHIIRGSPGFDARAVPKKLSRKALRSRSSRFRQSSKSAAFSRPSRSLHSRRSSKTVGFSRPSRSSRFSRSLRFSR